MIDIFTIVRDYFMTDCIFLCLFFMHFIRRACKAFLTAGRRPGRILSGISGHYRRMQWHDPALAHPLH
ncbi:hypothetical protein [Ferrovibrio xuzhouensis]|uniref:Uncharacterized protein n=1 Tax=Ferrovibrio xuzhouensis TaxID=1576914 RepID=A0ABV7VEW9_9PROT